MVTSKCVLISKLALLLLGDLASSGRGLSARTRNTLVSRPSARKQCRACGQGNSNTDAATWINDLCHATWIRASYASKFVNGSIPDWYGCKRAVRVPDASLASMHKMLRRRRKALGSLFVGLFTGMSWHYLAAVGAQFLGGHADARARKGHSSEKSQPPRYG